MPHIHAHKFSKLYQVVAREPGEFISAIRGDCPEGDAKGYVNQYGLSRKVCPNDPQYNRTVLISMYNSIYLSLSSTRWNVYNSTTSMYFSAITSTRILPSLRLCRPCMTWSRLGMLAISGCQTAPHTSSMRCRTMRSTTNSRRSYRCRTNIT